MGRGAFVERAGLVDDDFDRRRREVLQLIDAMALRNVRLSFADQHGILRGKTLTAGAVSDAFSSGCSMTTTLLLKDSSHRTVFPVWEAGAGLGRPDLAGAADFIMVPDPSTFRRLPWLESTGWMLCDLYYPDGTPVEVSTRRIAQDAVSRLADAGHALCCGLEMEFHVLKLDDANLRPGQAGQPADPPDVSLMSHGFQYLTETRQDELEPILEKLQSALLALDLPLRTLEVEFGPSQVEMTLAPQPALECADAAMLFRSAVKQVARRNGCHATFMCRPHVKDLFSSGWHLHQSLTDPKTGANRFMPSGGEEGPLSGVGRSYLAGLLRHAAASMPLTTPTLNGYKRYRPHTLAPENILWGRDNRGAMVRVIGGPGDAASRIENRVGEPAANPYLYITSQILSGLDGLKKGLEPPPASDTPYGAQDAEKLPASLIDALHIFDQSSFYRNALGDGFVDYLSTIKRAEIARFLSETNDWDQREYFEIF